MSATYRIEVYDAVTKAWRSFPVSANDHYEPKCGHSLHQFSPGAKACACGGITR